MKADLRELLGQALADQRRDLSNNWESEWPKRTEEAKEHDRVMAEAVVHRYLEILLPGFLMAIKHKYGDEIRPMTEKEFWELFGEEPPKTA